MRKRDIRLSLGAPLSVDRCHRGAVVQRSDALGKLSQGTVNIDCLRTPAVAGDDDLRIVLVPGTHGRIAGIAVLAARAGSARGLHVHARVIPSQDRGSYPRSLLIKNRNRRVGSLPQSRFALRGLSGNVLDAVDARYSAEFHNGSAGQGEGDGPGTRTRDAHRLIVAHAPRADRTGNTASKLLSVLTTPAGADLHDAHDARIPFPALRPIADEHLTSSRKLCVVSSPREVISQGPAASAGQQGTVRVAAVHAQRRWVAAVDDARLAGTQAADAVSGGLLGHRVSR